MAWEYNSQPIPIPGKAAAPRLGFLETSDNVIVEAMRREGSYIELRLAECFGEAGAATIKFHLPHASVSVTDFTGRTQSSLGKSSEYRIPLRPQQIVTLHFETASKLPDPEVVKEWDQFVPKDKLPALHAYDPKLIGHPPFGS
jgi:hypothetical protein